MNSFIPSTKDLLSFIRPQSLTAPQQEFVRDKIGIEDALDDWVVTWDSIENGALPVDRLPSVVGRKDQSNAWAETQLFQKPITVQDGGGNNVFDVVTNQIRFRSASAGYLLGPSGQCLAGEDVGGFYYGMGFTTPSKPIYIGQALTSQILANAQTINNRTAEFNILGVDGTGWGAFRAGGATFNGNISANAGVFSGTVDVRYAYWLRDSSGLVRWRHYVNTDDPSLYVRDQTYDRFHAIYSAGSTSATASTTFYSQLAVDGFATVKGLQSNASGGITSLWQNNGYGLLSLGNGSESLDILNAGDWRISASTNIPIGVYVNGAKQLEVGSTATTFYNPVSINGNIWAYTNGDIYAKNILNAAILRNSINDLYIGHSGNYSVTFATNNVEGMRLDPSRNLLIGKVSGSGARLDVAGKAMITYGTLADLNLSNIQTTAALTLAGNDPGDSDANKGVSLVFRPIEGRGAVASITAQPNSTNKEGHADLVFHTGAGGVPSAITEMVRLSSTGATVNGPLSSQGVTVTKASEGSIALAAGGTGNTGYLAFFKPNSTRQGFIGFDSGNDISFTNEQSGIFTFNKGALFGGTVTVNSGSSGRVGLGPDSYIEGTANDVTYRQAGSGSSYVDFGTSTVFRRTSDFATMATLTNGGDLFTRGSLTAHYGLSIKEHATGNLSWILYRNDGGPTQPLYLLDAANSRAQMYFIPGNTDANASTYLLSKLYVGEPTFFSKGINVTGPYTHTHHTSPPAVISYEYPFTRHMTGDGSGYTWAVSKRTGGVTTDLLTVYDPDGSVRIAGPTRIGAGGATGLLYLGDGNNWIYQNGNSFYLDTDGGGVAFRAATTATPYFTVTSSGNTTAWGSGSFKNNLAVSGPDAQNLFSLAGVSYGLRIGSTPSYGIYIEAVDPTLSATYQPLNLGGSTVRSSASLEALYGLTVNHPGLGSANIYSVKQSGDTTAHMRLVRTGVQGWHVYQASAGLEFQEDAVSGAGLALISGGGISTNGSVTVVGNARLEQLAAKSMSLRTYETSLSTWQEPWRGQASASGATIGFLGATPLVRQTLPAAATDAATTQSLANALRDLAINFGLAL